MMPRLREPEIMDDPSLDESSHRHALKGLSRINLWTGSAGLLFDPIQSLVEQQALKSVRVLDIATGSGDIPLSLWHRARKAGLDLQIDGCDLSDQALNYARSRARSAGAEVGFFQLDALQDPLPLNYDVITCSLFTHHLDPDQVIQLVRKMAQSASRMILINDLVRSRLNLALVYLGTRLLSSSRVVHFDGPVSVKAAYTVEEFRAMLQQADVLGAQVSARFPCRLLVNWKKVQ